MCSFSSNKFLCKGFCNMIENEGNFLHWKTDASRITKKKHQFEYECRICHLFDSPPHAKSYHQRIKSTSFSSIGMKQKCDSEDTWLRSGDGWDVEEAHPAELLPLLPPPPPIRDWSADEDVKAMPTSIMWDSFFSPPYECLVLTLQ